MLKVPSLASVWDGFKFTVTEVGGNVSGRVTAPMGVVVICNGPDELGVTRSRHFVADSWVSGFSLKTNFKMLDYDAGGNSITALFQGYTEAELIASGFSTHDLRLLVPLDYYPPPLGPNTFYESMPYPFIMPYRDGEVYWVGHTGWVHVDLNDDGVVDADEYQNKSEIFFNYYSSDGGALDSRITFYRDDEYDPSFPYMHIFQVMPSADMTMVRHYIAPAYYDKDSMRIPAYYYSYDYEAFTNSYFALDDLVVDFPAALQTAITDLTPGSTSIKPLGNYSFSLEKDGTVTLLHFPDLTNQLLPTVGGGSAQETYFATGSEDWRLSYIFGDWDAAGAINISTVNSNNFLTLLDTIEGGNILGPPVDWYLALEILRQFIGSPNYNYLSPVDTSMFHDKDGNVYSWTRTYGAVKFARTGMSQVTLTIPTEASGTDFVKPAMTWCGEYLGNNVYLCVCERFLGASSDLIPVVFRTGEILKLYYGSPHSGEGGWTALPDAPADHHLVYVRPAKVEYDLSGVLTVSLIGILEDELNSAYHFAILNYVDGVGEWQRLAKIPVDVSDYYVWGAALFGNDTLVNGLQDFVSPPAVLPQMPLGPNTYGDYSQP